MLGLADSTAPAARRPYHTSLAGGAGFEFLAHSRLEEYEMPGARSLGRRGGDRDLFSLVAEWGGGF